MSGKPNKVVGVRLSQEAMEAYQQIAEVSGITVGRLCKEILEMGGLTISTASKMLEERKDNESGQR